jgi:hypothetical protein
MRADAVSKLVAVVRPVAQAAFAKAGRFASLCKHSGGSQCSTGLLTTRAGLAVGSWDSAGWAFCGPAETRRPGYRGYALMEAKRNLLAHAGGSFTQVLHWCLLQGAVFALHRSVKVSPFLAVTRCRSKQTPLSFLKNRLQRLRAVAVCQSRGLRVQCSLVGCALVLRQSAPAAK